MAQTEPVIANYDDLTAEEIKQRLRKLSQADLTKLEAYEKQGQARSTVLEAIAALRGDEPWPSYDDMEVEDVNDALKQGNSELAGRVLDYERHHKGRTTIIEFAKRRREASDASSAATAAGERESQTDTRSQSSKSSSRPKRQANRSSSASSGRGSKSGSSSRSTRGRSAKAAASRTRAKTSSRPSATRSSRSQQPKRSQSSRPRSQSNSASQSRTEAREAALAKIRQRATQALRSGEGRTSTLAKDTQRAVGSKAKDSRDAVGTAVKDTGQAVQTAANKARTPALVGAATLAALGGGIALGRGSKVRLRKRKRVLGVPVPRRTAFGKAAKQMSKAVDSAGSAGKQVADWSDGLQELRHKIADGKSPASKLSGV